MQYWYHTNSMDQALYTQGSSSSEGRPERMSEGGRNETEENDMQEEQEKEEGENMSEEEEELIPLEEACVICQVSSVTVPVTVECYPHHVMHSFQGREEGFGLYNVMVLAM